MSVLRLASCPHVILSCVRLSLVCPAAHPQPQQFAYYHRISLPSGDKKGFDQTMEFDAVLERLRRLQSMPSSASTPVSSKEAAVLVPLFQDAQGDVRVILTQRSSTLRTHRGEVALPGGKKDPDDGTAVNTALREAQEEMGLDPQDVEVIASMPPVLSKHFLSVTPVIGILTRDLSEALSPNPGEVNAIFDMPLRFFLEDDQRHTFDDVHMGGYQYRIHHFQYGAFEVWGLTAGILIGVAQIAFGRVADFDTLGTGVDYTCLWFDGKRVQSRLGPSFAAPHTL